MSISKERYCNMHHFLYPTQDAYISNKSNQKDYNFGLDEMLILGVSHSYAKVLNSTKTYHFGNEYVVGMNFQNFTGTFTGSFFGVVYNTSGSIVGGITQFTTSYFSGNVSGSVDGNETGSSLQNANFSGSLIKFSGSINSYIIDGVITGSLTANCFDLYTGQFYVAVGNGTGYVTGDEIKQEENITTTLSTYINRSLVKFNLDFISQSIVNGDITNPEFYLKIKSTEARELPITYKIYAFPVNQSWEQGDGYFSDGGSTEGASWNWRDRLGSTPWYPYVNDPLTASVDYLENYNLATQSWSHGGGTWTNVPCTQSFYHEVSDINMNVTSIVNYWLNNQDTNNGFILMYGGETDISASNAHLFFFSRETNTIYSPQLDVAWDDSQYVTGSFGTGSITILNYNPQISGSISSGSVVTNVIATGSFSGTAFLNVDQSGSIVSGSLVSAVGRSLTIKNIPINGSILGESTVDESGSLILTASFDSGDFTGCLISAQYSHSMITGMLSGSFTSEFFEGYGITGSVLDSHVFVINATQYSLAAGDMIGKIVSGSLTSGIFQGVSTTGLLIGGNVTIPFTGSYSYVTSSLSFTSSIEITGSGLQPLNLDKPFVVIIQDLKKEYNSGDIPRIGVFAREHFPLKTFEKAPQQPNYVTPKYLPTSSYYSIKDNETEEIIVGFDNYTKISCDQSGNYFYLDTTGLSQERYYRVLIKVVGPDEVYTFDGNNLFKVRR